MPAPPLLWTGEHGADGTTITPANSGGVGSDAFQIVTSTPTFSTLQAHSGTKSMRINQGASFVAKSATWTGLGSITADLWSRVYIFMGALSSVNGPQLFSFLNAAGAQCADLVIQNSTGTPFVRMRNAANSTVLTGAVNAVAGQWIRVEMRVRAATVNGQLEFRLFNNADSTVASDTAVVTNAVLAANVDQIRPGHGNTGPTNVDWFFDDIAVSTAGWIGPSVSTATRRLPIRRTMPQVLTNEARMN